MKFNKAYLKSPKLYVGLILLLAPFFPDVQDLLGNEMAVQVITQFVGGILSLFGAKDAKEKAKELK